jgi:hypothetical protein
VTPQECCRQPGGEPGCRLTGTWWLPVTDGQVAEGYWLTNILVTPERDGFFGRPESGQFLPPFVETEPPDLTGLNDDTDIRATLAFAGITGRRPVCARADWHCCLQECDGHLTPEITGLPPSWLPSSPIHGRCGSCRAAAGPAQLYTGRNPDGLEPERPGAGNLPGDTGRRPAAGWCAGRINAAAKCPGAHWPGANPHRDKQRGRNDLADTLSSPGSYNDAPSSALSNLLLKSQGFAAGSEPQAFRSRSCRGWLYSFWRGDVWQNPLLL